LLCLLYTRVKLLVISGHIGLLETDTKEYALETLFSQLLKGEILAKFFAVMDLNAQLFHHFYLPECLFDGGSVLRDLMAHNTSTDLILLEDVNVVVAHSSEEGGATERGRASTNDSDGLLVRRGKVLRERGVTNLGYSHLLKDSNGKLL
jgi:hypothetical protein